MSNLALAHCEPVQLWCFLFFKENEDEFVPVVFRGINDKPPASALKTFKKGH
jgi:hypothetical protein